ncbi:MAG: hypothetical protein B6I24_01365 [Bacteroidetes bacterium 4572_128]|nr:MAG: hypothetical protein B6I24_01365 [Bacteroidetes bacterium 4572_128]
MAISNEEVNLFINTVKNASSYNFSNYSERSFARRLDKILKDNQIDVYSLISKIRRDNIFLEKIVKDITVNTTELFRDPKTWHIIRYRVLSKLKNQRTINIWHAGCSTGQEVYSMLVLLKEMNLFDKANVFASDINSDVLELAKKGSYKYRFNINYLENFDSVIKTNPYNFEEYKEVSFAKYFIVDKQNDTIKVKDLLKNKVLFRKHDLVNGNNIFYTKFDLILCRNVLIYFNHKLQNQVFENFHKYLFPNGSLILGIHESMLGAASAKYNKRGLVYIKKS